MAIIGMIFIVFGIIDFAGMFLGYDLTGVSWSPVVAGVIGSALLNAGGSDDEEPETHHTPDDHEEKDPTSDAS